MRAHLYDNGCACGYASRRAALSSPCARRRLPPCQCRALAAPRAQVRLVEAGALRPLVSMMSVHAEPRHYAGLALLKLADNFENHVRIAEEGGIQALLRLGRSRATDEELQYKAALTVGHLASNAVRLLPKQRVAGPAGTDIGVGAVAMGKSGAAAREGKKRTKAFLDKGAPHSQAALTHTSDDGSGTHSHPH